MSHNLRLVAGTKYPYADECSLVQTPTDVTRRALASSDPKRVYFDFLDDVLVDYCRPAPRHRRGLSPAARRKAEASPEWRRAREAREEAVANVEAFKDEVRRFLEVYPDARWISN